MTEIHEILHAERKILDKIERTNQIGETRSNDERHAVIAVSLLCFCLRRQQRKLQNFLSILRLTFSSPDFFLPETKEAGKASDFPSVQLHYFTFVKTLFLKTMLENLEIRFYRGGRGRTDAM